jgi:hypothetical protein
MGKARTKKLPKDLFVKCTHTGKTFVLLKIVMPLLVALIDGIPLVTFTKRKAAKPYIELDRAIDWLKKEMQMSHGKYLSDLEIRLQVLEVHKQKFAEEDQQLAKETIVDKPA